MVMEMKRATPRSSPSPSPSPKAKLTDYSSVGDEDDRGVDRVSPQAGVLHWSHLPDHGGCDDGDDGGDGDDGDGCDDGDDDGDGDVK